MPNADEPVFRDIHFRQKRKHGAWRVVEAPRLEGPVADTHAHLHMLADPALSLARCAVHGVRFVNCVCDVCEDDVELFDRLEVWESSVPDVLEELREAGFWRLDGEDFAGQADSADPERAARDNSLVFSAIPIIPRTRIVVGCHPHNAKRFDASSEARLRKRLQDGRVCAIGEIGLDFHYDLSERSVQRAVFRRQLQMAHELGFPVVLHIREAHEEACEILSDEGCPAAGVVLHCFNLGPEELQPFLDMGCYVAFGGPLTFKNADEVRRAAALVPRNRLLTETDSPYMTPEPMRGANCGPEHTVFTAARLCEVCGAETPQARARLLDACYANACEVFGVCDKPSRQNVFADGA